MLVLGWVRGGVILLFNRAQVDETTAPEWGGRFIVLIGLVGVTWGYGGAFVLPDSTAEQVFFILMLGGTAAGTVATLGSVAPAILLALTTSLLPLIVRLALEGTFEQLLMSGALVMFFMAMTATGRNAGEMTRLALSLKLRNEDLVASLDREKQELAISNRAKTRFLAAASHDLRQPLHALNLTVAAYRIRDKSKELDPMFGRIDRSVQAMESLVNSLLDISKLDAGAITPSMESFRLDDLLAMLESEFSGLASEAGSTVSLQRSDITLHTDQTLLASILRNLIGNAIKHAPGSTVTVSAEARDGTAYIRVEDNGPGIPPEVQDKVFEEFYQGETGPTDQGGLGLGLAIVRRLAQLIGGNVTLAPHAKVGACFEVTLPGVKTSGAHVATPSTASPVAPDADIHLAGRRIVVLEDDVHNRIAMLDLLEEWGCEAFGASNASALIEVLEQSDPGFEPQLILSDYQLGSGGNGIENIEQLRDHFAAREMPAVLLTGDAAPELLRQLAGLQLEILHKPVDTEQLAECLRRHVP